MGGLRDRLRGWQMLPEFQRELSESPQLVEVAQRVERDLGGVKAREPDSYRLKETHEAFLAATQNPDTIRSLSRKHLRRAPWVLFQPWEDQDRPLADDLNLLEAYLKRVTQLASSGVTATLAYCFLYFYPADSRFFESVRKAILRLTERVESPRIRRFKACHGQVGLFAENGPEVLAKVILDSREDPEKVMEEGCLASGLGSRGFSARGFAQAMALIKRELESGRASLERLDQLLRWALTGDGGDKVLRYSGARARLPEALLEPFNTTNPGAEAQQRIKNFLLDHYGDPRLSKAMWQGTKREAQEVMFRWLVQATLEDFFRFLDHVASHDKEADRHWRYRRAFWTVYLEAGMIEEAWVAFGPEARREAHRRLEGLKNNYSELQAGYNVKRNHAVLLLRIGDLVITEWSHMGKFRVWHVDNEKAPRFYQPAYRRDQIVLQPDFEGSHHGSESGSWQRKLSTYIREQTGFSIPLKDLMP